MLTGDHPSTALAVADRIGIRGNRVLTGEDLAGYGNDALIEALSEVNIFARVRPEQKLRIVEALQAQGQIVAMTGVARAVAFHFMAVGQVLLTYPSRPTSIRPLPNRFLHAAVIAAVGIQIGAVSLPFASDLLGDAAIPKELWSVVFRGRPSRAGIGGGELPTRLA
jgi:hypothetical protein